MRIAFTKISDDQHAVTVTRTDGTTERVEVPSRSFLRHDLAHFAIEVELPIRRGFWGCISAGASLTGAGIGGEEAMLAETLAGPLQTLMRIDADLDAYAKLLTKVSPADNGRDLALRVHERIRQLRGHWKSTPYGGEMQLEWPE